MIYIDDHIVNVWKAKDGSELLVTLYWGDDVLSATPDGEFTKIALSGDRIGWVRGTPRLREAPLLSLAFVDVGQGDACVLTTPCNRQILIDGGENQQLARYPASRYWHLTSDGKEVLFDAVVITHGDADHFEGLPILVFDAAEEDRERKRIRFATRRVFHSGLVTYSTRLPDGNPRECRLGATATGADGKEYVVSLHDDPRKLPREHLSRSFQRWAATLDELQRRCGDLVIQRIDHSSDAAFAFVHGAKIEVLGPRPQPIGASGSPGLPLIGAGAGATGATINDHSVVLAVSLGNVRILLTGDIGEHAGQTLASEHHAGRLDLRAHVLKVPHHGSDDTALEFLAAVSPVVSIISAGDENARRDYLHPRACIVGALGRNSSIAWARTA